MHACIHAPNSASGFPPLALAAYYPHCPAPTCEDEVVRGAPGAPACMRFKLAAADHLHQQQPPAAVLSASHKKRYRNATEFRFDLIPTPRAVLVVHELTMKQQVLVVTGTKPTTPDVQSDACGQDTKDISAPCVRPASLLTLLQQSHLMPLTPSGLMTAMPCRSSAPSWPVL